MALLHGCGSLVPNVFLSLDNLGPWERHDRIGKRDPTSLLVHKHHSELILENSWMRGKASNMATVSLQWSNPEAEVCGEGPLKGGLQEPGAVG